MYRTVPTGLTEYTGDTIGLTHTTQRHSHRYGTDMDSYMYTSDCGQTTISLWSGYVHWIEDTHVFDQLLVL